MEMDAKDKIIRIVGDAISEVHRQELERKIKTPDIPDDYTELERIIAGMLYENTGAHILDSGDLYGRHWERNRKVKDFRKLPKITIDIWDNSWDAIDISINVFHFLVNELERDKTCENLEKKLYEFANTEEEKDNPWLAIMEDFTEELEEDGEFEVKGTFNTYNWENLLSQVLQGIIIENRYTKEDYVILQIHNGCDVRGGYTAPRIFKLIDYDSFFIDMSEIAAGCECTAMYSDDNGYHWYDVDTGEEGIPEYWEIDKENNKIICKKCGKEVNFSPNF